MTTERERNELADIRERQAARQGQQEGGNHSSNQGGGFQFRGGASASGGGPKSGFTLPSLQKLELLYRRYFPQLYKYSFLIAGGSYLWHLYRWQVTHTLWFLMLPVTLYFAHRFKRAMAPHALNRRSTLAKLIIGYLCISVPWQFGSWAVQSPLAAVLMYIVLVFVFFLFEGGFGSKLNHRYVKGAKEWSPRLAFNQHMEEIKAWIAAGKHPNELVNFVGMPLTTLEATTHFLYVGETRSGKSLLMSIFLPILAYPGKRALIYDYAGNFYGKLLAIGIHSDRIINLNPFHADCYEWLLCKDLTNESIQYDFAVRLFPVSGSEAFFSEYAAGFVAAAMQTLMRAAKDAGVEPSWGLKELCYFCSDKKRLWALLSTYADIADSFDELSQGGDQAQGGISTVQNTFRKLRPVAECQYRARQLGRSISLKEFPDKDWILLLGRDEEKGKQQLNFYNGAVITFCCGQIIGRPTTDDTKPANTFIIADEFQSLGKIGKLRTVTTEGGKYGFSAVLTTQSLHYLREVYSQGELASLLGSITHLAALKTTEQETAKWLSEQFGDVTLMKASTTTTRSMGGERSSGTTMTEATEPLYTPGHFQSQPKINMKEPSSTMGVTVRSDEFIYQMQMNPETLISMLPPKPSANQERLNVSPQAEDILNFTPLTDADFDRLGLPHLKQGAQSSQPVAFDPEAMGGEDMAIDADSIRFN